MIYEKSCGAVVFTEKDGRRLYLIELMQKGHRSICKGHVEEDESERQTAEREIREETGLEVLFIDGFRETIEYSPYDGCMKTVVFFLAEALSTDVTVQEEEVREVSWLPFEEALAALTFESDKETLRKADRFFDFRFKTGDGWKACFDEKTGTYTAERSGIGYYQLYEIPKETFDLLDDGMSDRDTYKVICEGRRLYMDVNDRCGPPYTIVFDEDYEKLCPWAEVMQSGRIWPVEFTDAVVEVLESEKNNREQRRKKREERESAENGTGAECDDTEH